MTPNESQIELLRQRPDLAAQFDEKFGAGTAAQFLSDVPSPAPAGPAPIPDPIIPPLTEGDQEEETSLAGLVADVATALPAGIADGIEAAGDKVAMAADAIGLPAGVQIDMDGIDFLSLDELNAQGGDEFFGEIGTPDNALPEQTTIAGSVTRGVSQFLSGFLPGLSALKGAKLIQGTGLGAAFLRGSVAGAAADLTVFDAQEQRLSNLVQEFPLLANPVSEFLAADEDDGEVEGSVKNALEGLLLGGVVETFLRSLRAVREARKVAATEGPEAASRILDEASTALNAVDEVAEEVAQPSRPEIGITRKGEEGFEPIAEETDVIFRSQRKGPDGSPTGEALLEASTEGSNLRVRWTEALGTSLGTGDAKNAYKRAIQFAQENGLQFVSDDSVTESAMRVYKSLEKEGFTFEFNPNVKPGETLGGTGGRQSRTQSAVDGEPVVRLTGVPEDFGKAADEVTEEAVQAAPKVTPERPSVDTEALLRGFTRDGGAEFTGRPGVFNWDKMTTSDAAKGVIEETATALKETEAFQSQSFEEISERAARELADVVSGKPEQILSAMARQAEDASDQAARLVAGKQMMVSLAADIEQRAARIVTGVASDADRAELLKLVQVHTDLARDLKAVQSAAARTTAAGRIPVGEALSPDQIKQAMEGAGGPDNIDRLAELLHATEGSAEKVAKVLKPNKLRRLIEGHNEIWINALLSHPATHAVNITSNTINTLVAPFERALGAAAVGDVRAMRESLRTYMGFRRAFTDSAVWTWKSLRTGENFLDPHLTSVDAPRHIIQSQREDILGEAINWLGTAVRLPSRLLGTADEFAKQMNFRADLYARSVGEGVDRGLNGNALAEFIERRFASGIDAVDGRGLDEEALRIAREATFTQELAKGSPSRALQNFVRDFPIFKTIVPFIRTPINIVKAIGNRAPGLALLARNNRQALSEGGRRASEVRGRMAFGSLMIAGATMLSAEGRLTGKGPSNPNERKILLESGWQPYSFVVTGDDGKKRYVSFQRLDPFASFFAAAADLQEIGQHVEGEDTYGEAAAAVVTAVANSLSSKTYLRGLTEAINAFSQPDRFAERWLQNRVASYTGGIEEVAGLAGLADDPYMREAHTIVEAVQREVPWWNEDLPPLTSWLTGEPVRTKEGFVLPDEMAFARISEQSGNKALQQISDLGFGFSPPARSIEGIELNSAQYARLRELTAKPTPNTKVLIDVIGQVLSNPQFKDMGPVPPSYDDQSSNDPRVRAIKKVIAKYKQAARRRLLQEDPELAAQVAEVHAKRQQVRTGVVQEGPVDTPTVLEISEWLKDQ